MKTFKDLKFKVHRIGQGEIAQMNFDNDYGVSVLCGETFHSDGFSNYEVAVLYKDQLTYSTHIIDDVIGYQSKEEVTKIMKQIQEL